MGETVKEDDYIDIIKDFFWLDDRKDAENMYKKMNRMNALTKINAPEKPNIIESISAYLADVITLCKSSIDEKTPKSVEEFLNAYYEEYYSQLHEETNLNTLKLALSHDQKKKYHEDSCEDLEKMALLLESHSQGIIRQWLREKDYEDHIVDFTKISKQFMVLLRVYMTVCILKEIAYIRSKGERLLNTEIIGSIIKIKSYHDLSMLSNRNYHENQSFVSVLLSRKGRTNIKKRWERQTTLKEALKIEAKDIAEKLWSSGDQSLHNDVVKSIYEKIKASHEDLKNTLKENYLVLKHSDPEFKKMERIDQITTAEKYADKSILILIRKAIIPIAEKYSRVFGMKGVSKS